VLLDGSGRPVVSRRDTAALARVAEATGGEALAADRWGQIDSATLLGAVRRGARPTADGFVERRVPVSRFAPAAALALALLLLEAAPLRGAGLRRLAGAARVAARRRGRRTAGAAAALALLALPARAGDPLALEDALRDRPDDAHLLVALGVARAESGALREAESAFLAAASRTRDPRLAALATYDLGVALLERGDFEGARDAFFDALALDPGDRRAKFNLEWTLRALAQRPEPGGDAPRDEHEGSGLRDAPPDVPGDVPPESEREKSPQGRPEPDERGEEGRARAPLPALEPAEARRWLRTVEDHPERALRDAARAAAPPRARTGPRW
jgi:tetratricopeptide (TPR) repeat protein